MSVSLREWRRLAAALCFATGAGLIWLDQYSLGLTSSDTGNVTPDAGLLPQYPWQRWAAFVDTNLLLLAILLVWRAAFRPARWLGSLELLGFVVLNSVYVYRDGIDARFSNRLPLPELAVGIGVLTRVCALVLLYRARSRGAQLPQ